MTLMRALSWSSICGLALIACGARSRLDPAALADDAGTDAGGSATAANKDPVSWGGCIGISSDDPTRGGTATSRGGCATRGGPVIVGGTLGGAPTDAAGAPSFAECTEDADCAKDNPCVSASCQAGQCQSVAIARGTLIAPNTPADCHASACDGQGHVQQVLDLANHPSSTTSCAVTSCDASGAVVSKPSPAGTACQAAGGARWCDGAGHCVACLTGADCAEGSCVDHFCVSSSCNDGTLDGSESDVDCGGFCRPCPDTETCRIDQDCASDDCEPVRHLCLPRSCLDGKRDNLETDVDCGGRDCSPCYNLKKCKVNADCATKQCDQKSATCFGNVCADGRLDGSETDVDCGGLDCKGCKTGGSCRSTFDCASGLSCTRMLGQAYGVCVSPP